MIFPCCHINDPRNSKDPASRLSAHYVIGHDGRIAQLVSEDDTAYHAGRFEDPLVWTTRLQRWLAKAIRSVFPNADVSGPDVESGQPFKG